MTYEIPFGNFLIGYRYSFDSHKRFTPIVETELIYERRLKELFVKKHGFAIGIKIGTSIRLSDHLNAVVGAVCKSGIVKYNEHKFNEDYVPYAYGLELGANYRI